MSKIVSLHKPPKELPLSRVVFDENGNYWRGSAFYAYSLFDTYADMAEENTPIHYITATLTERMGKLGVEHDEKVVLGKIQQDDEGDWIITDLPLTELVDKWQVIRKQSLNKKTRKIIPDSAFDRLEKAFDAYSDWEENFYWAIDDAFEMIAENDVEVDPDVLGYYNDKAKEEINAALLSHFMHTALKMTVTGDIPVPMRFGDLTIDFRNFAERQKMRRKLQGEEIDISQDTVILEGKRIHPIPEQPTLRVLRP